MVLVFANMCPSLKKSFVFSVWLVLHENELAVGSGTILSRLLLYSLLPQCDAFVSRFALVLLFGASDIMVFKVKLSI